MRARLKDYLLAALITSCYWLYGRLWSVRHIRYPTALNKKGPVIFAHWHGDELLLIRAYTWSKMAVMTSRSKDGELMRLVLEWFGFKVVRGSSTRGGAGGLKGLIDAVDKEKWNASLAVDGPRGPIYRVKPGILKLAEQTGVPIVPGAAAASRRYIFQKAWNKCYVPAPLSRAIIVYGEPVSVPRGASDETLEKIRKDLEQQLISLKNEAESEYKRPFVVSSHSETTVPLQTGV